MVREVHARGTEVSRRNHPTWTDKQRPGTSPVGVKLRYHTELRWRILGARAADVDDAAYPPCCRDPNRRVPRGASTKTRPIADGEDRPPRSIILMLRGTVQALKLGQCVSAETSSHASGQSCAENSQNVIDDDTDPSIAKVPRSVCRQGVISACIGHRYAALCRAWCKSPSQGSTAKAAVSCPPLAQFGHAVVTGVGARGGVSKL